MVKNVLKRFTSIMLIAVMVLLMLPIGQMTVHAESVNTGVEGLSADSSGNAKWTSSGGTITGNVTASSSSGCTGTTYTAQEGTLTLKNTSGAKALVSFDIGLVLSEGKVTLDDAALNAATTFSKPMEADETVVIKITSNAANTNVTTVTISNIKLSVISSINVIFKAPVNGSYTVNGAAITEDTPIRQQSSEPFTVNASADSGYKFAAWKNCDDGSYISFKATDTWYLDRDQTIEPVFVSNDTALFDVDGNVFMDLNDATTYATNNNISKITLLSDGTIRGGDYIIPNGKILLIPFDEANTVYTTSPDVVCESHVNPSAFRTLTLADGARITVANGGAISVPSKLCATGTGNGSWNGTPTGKHGRINLNGNSSIQLESGAKLYCYGYIAGSGAVTAESGSEVWECFQIRCWRGGTATSGMAGNSGKVFPLNQYYVQNIEAPLQIMAGATEKVYTAVNMGSKAYAASATFIGSGGMFNTSSGSLVKRYEGSTDRLVVDLAGSCSLTPMSLKITGLPLIGTLDLNTADYVLPINSNITVNVESGNTTVSQDLALFPGTELNVANGAKLDIASGNKVYVYDKDQWGAYGASGEQLVVVGYSTVNGTTAKRTAASLIDSKVDVNGEIDVNGAMYTTEGGADIISSQGIGKINLKVAPGNETDTYQATQSGSDMTYVSIPITPAKLHNGCADPEYTETAGESANTVFGYCHACDKWVKLPHNDNTYTITWKNDDGTVLETDENVPEGTEPEYNGEAPTKEPTAETTFTFAGWTPEVVEATADAVYTAKYTESPRKYTITWKNEDGTVLQSSGVAYGETPTYDGPTPVKDADAQYTYTFAGWDSEIVPVTGEATYTATYTGELNKYTVTWKNADGTVLETDENVPYGTTPTYDGATPTKEGDVQYTYTFDGWTPEVTDVTGDVTYTAKFSSTVNEYTITWKNEDGSVLQTGKVPFGETPEYTGETPEKDSDEQYTYAHTGWTPEVAPVSRDAEYTAVFTPTVRTYTITWKDDDGTVLEKDENVAYGAMPSYDSPAPSKEADAQYTYAFTGWTPEISEVKGDATYTATYSSTVNKYTVTWLNEDGTELEKDVDVPYGETPTYDGAEPAKAETEMYTYTFAGWDPEVTAVTGDVTYKASFTEVIKTFTVTWKNADGTVLETDDSVAYGTVPEYNGDTPVKEADAQYTYFFAGWDPTVTAVTADAEYKATYTTEKKTYTVTWLHEDGTELEKDENVPYGETPSYDGAEPVKDATAQYTYTFAGWEPSVDAVTGDVEYKAVFTSTVNEYTVKWLNYNGDILDTDSVKYRENPVYSGETPAKPADEQFTYTFTGWTPKLAEVTGDVEYTAVYEENTRSYTVTWMNSNGEVLETDENVLYGTTPTYDGADPSIPSTEQYTYTFKGWTPDIAKVTGDATYTAAYDSETRTYTVTFNANEGSGTMNPQEVSYGETVNLNKNQFIKDGYEFSKWTTEADGSGSVYYDEAELAGGLSSDLILYAQWMLAGWHEDENGWTYYENGVKAYLGTWAIIDGKEYYFDTNGYTVNGLYRTAKDGEEATFVFDNEKGAFRSEQNGLYESGEDIYWTENGKVVEFAGLQKVVKDNGEINYYYFGEDSKAVKDGTHKVKNNNNLKLPCANYNFGPDGVIEHDPDTSKNGVCEGDDSVFYYIDGVKVGVGLIQINGSYYYARTSSGEIVRDRSYWITQTNKLAVEAGIYEFDKDGKMILNGWIHDGSNTYYYVDGDRAKGLTKIGDDYYFFNKSSGKLYKGMTLWVGDNEYGFVGGMYYFDAEGKMVIPDLENGEKKIVSDEGNLYLTIDGKRMTDGLYELDGEYYYAQSSGKLAVNKAVYASNKEEGVISTLQAKKNYWLYFGEGGKLQKTGFVETKDGTYYYKDCSIALGFTKIGDDYYLFNRSNGRMSRNATMWVGDNGYGIEGGMYYFDAEGKMAQ